MPADPQILKVGADPGKIKNTLTGIRSVFPNVAIHRLISEEYLPFRMALSRRNEFQTPGLWEGNLVTWVQSHIDRMTGRIRQVTYKDPVPVSTPLATRQDALNQHVDRMVSDESIEDIANDPAATHSDMMLQPANPRIQSLTFDWTGNDPNLPQPTPGRVADPSARVLITGLDIWVVEMTNSPSSNANRTINKQDAAMWIGWLADLFNVAKSAATNENPYIPGALMRGQYDNIWNSDGSFDPSVGDGDGQMGEQLNTFVQQTTQN